MGGDGHFKVHVHRRTRHFVGQLFFGRSANAKKILQNTVKKHEYTCNDEQIPVDLTWDNLTIL